MRREAAPRTPPLSNFPFICRWRYERTNGRCSTQCRPFATVRCGSSYDCLFTISYLIDSFWLWGQIVRVCKWRKQILDISMAYWINIFQFIYLFKIWNFRFYYARNNSVYKNYICTYFMNLLRLYFCLLYISESSMYFNYINLKIENHCFFNF